VPVALERAHFSFSRAPPSKPYTQLLGSNPGRSSNGANADGTAFPYEGNTPRGFDTRARDIFSRVHPSRAHTHFGIAHLVERQTSRLNVAGSSPASKPTRAPLTRTRTFFRAQPDKPNTLDEVTGSIPVEGSCALVAQWQSTSLERNIAASLLGRESFTIEDRHG
jgi:hypothetical protein